MTGLFYNVFMTKDRNYPQGKEHQNLAGQIISKVKTITYDDEAVPCNRSNYLFWGGLRRYVLRWD
jgi:hypothetical protein